MSKQMILKSLQNCAIDLEIIEMNMDATLTLNNTHISEENVKHFNLYGTGREVRVTDMGEEVSLIGVNGDEPFLVPTVCLETFEQEAEREADRREAWIERNYTEA